MKSLFKKSVKLTLAGLCAMQARDTLNQNYFTEKRQFFQNPIAEAEENIFDPSQDYVGSLIKNEFTGDISHLKEQEKVKFNFKLKTREEHLKEIMDPKQQYDLLIVGGGANGAGVALEAASRGLKCAVIDSYDFASGTSSRSTKMAHGGIRYFEQMMKIEGDPFENYGLLKETLHERNYFLNAVPYQNKQLKLLIPGGFFESVFMYYPACLAYHLIYLRQLMKSNYEAGIDGPSLIFKNKLARLFENVKYLHGKYGVLLNESQMMDSRMNLLALLTSSVESFIPGMKGANLANQQQDQINLFRKILMCFLIGYLSQIQNREKIYDHYYTQKSTWYNQLSSITQDSQLDIQDQEQYNYKRDVFVYKSNN